MAGNAETVVALEHQRMKAMGARDVGTLDKLLSDDLFYVHSSARVDTKHSLIGGMESGSTVYSSVAPSDIVARDYGDTVVLNGLAAIKVTVNGNPLEFTVRYTDVWVRKGDNWQMTVWQSTKLP